jgi:hypothetical protein
MCAPACTCWSMSATAMPALPALVCLHYCAYHHPWTRFYSFNITRALPDVVSLEVVGFGLLDDSWPLPVSQGPLPFAGGRMVYQASAPYAVQQLAVRVTYATPDSPVTRYSGLGGGLTALAAPLSGSLSPQRFALAANGTALNVLQLPSARDSNYSLTIWRGAPYALSLQLRASVGPSGDESSQLFPLSPRFTAGVLSGYRVVLPRVRTGVSIMVLLSQGSVFFYTNTSSALCTLTASQCSSPVLLPAADARNAFRPPSTLLTVHSSEDSNYTLVISYAEPDLTALQLRYGHVHPTGAGAVVTASMAPAFAPGAGSRQQCLCKWSMAGQRMTQWQRCSRLRPARCPGSPPQLLLWRTSLVLSSRSLR